MILKTRTGNCSRKRKQAVRKTANESINRLVLVLNCFRECCAVDTLITGPLVKDTVTQTQHLSRRIECNHKFPGVDTARRYYRCVQDTPATARQILERGYIGWAVNFHGRIVFPDIWKICKFI
jgi:hypothetical protein